MPSLREVLEIIPGGSQTFSKQPSLYPERCPRFIQCALGSHCWDENDKEYIDYVSSLGAIILGYSDLSIDRFVVGQLERGSIFSLPHPLEFEVAKLLTELIPCAEMVRFGKNGNDATSAAIRLARAYTGKDIVVTCGYHGCQDWSIAETPGRNLGVPVQIRRLTKTFIYNDIASLNKIFNENPGTIACIILEPVRYEEPRNDFLEYIRILTRQKGSLLIFDEVVSGFRFDLGGAQKLYDVIPDLACFGKAMSNGFPLSALVGKRKIMKHFDGIFYSTTFGGECLSLAAAKATIEKMRREPVIEHLYRQGKKLKETWPELKGLPPFLVLEGKSEETMRKLRLEFAKRGILFLNGFNLTYSHSDEDIEKTIKAIKEIVPCI